MPTAIEFNNISKQYRLGLVSTRTLSHDLNRWWQTAILHKEDPYLKVGSINDRSKAADSEYVWALRDIDFNVEQGDVVGIIGKNGAGKSTLLKLLSRVTGPTTGTIKAKGRIGSLLEVGTGFHAEMTGRENIYMNGAILGMTKAEITRKLDEIVDFSGCERYIDTPVKRYSSGMMVRLGFAVAAHLDPEILVVDEVLAVGDAEFQKKAIGKMQDVSKGEGRTVLFVSHNMASVQQLCKTGVVLDQGRVAFMGSAGEAINYYLQDNEKRLTYKDVPNDDPIQLLEAQLVSSDGQMVESSSELTLRMLVCVRRKIKYLVMGFNLYSSYGYPIARADFNDYDRLHTVSEGTYEIIFKIPPHTLATGEYRIIFDVADIDVKNYAKKNSVLTFDVASGETRIGNVFNEVNALKCSVFHQKWLQEYHKLN